MSHAIANSTPWPTHQPLIAATMGLLIRDNGPRVIPHRPSSRRSRPTIGPTVCHSGACVFKSAPAVNASPVPVITATRSAGVAEVAPDIAQQFVGFDVYGVLDLWAVQGDVGDLAALLVKHFC